MSKFQPPKKIIIPPRPTIEESDGLDLTECGYDKENDLIHYNGKVYLPVKDISHDLMYGDRDSEPPKGIMNA